MGPQKYLYIDSLRGLAILLVLLVHNGQSSCFPHQLNLLIRDGQYGVQLFFLVSAFTLMLSYENRKEEKSATLKFYTRRFFRIAPMYYIALIYFFFQNYIGFNYFYTGEIKNSIPWDAVLSNALFIHGIKPTWINSAVPGGWSIAVEMTFYLLLPFICKVITNINRSFIFLLGCLLLSSLFLIVLKNTSLDTMYFLNMYFPNQLPIFALGIFAYYLSKGNFGQISKNSMFFLIFTCFVYIFLPFPRHFQYSLCFFVLLMTLSSNKSKFIVNPFFVYIGKISFSIYFVHFAVLYWLSEIGFENFIPIVDFKTAILNKIMQYLTLLSFSVFISHFTHKYIEIYFKKIGRNVIRKFDNQFSNFSK